MRTRALAFGALLLLLELFLALLALVVSRRVGPDGLVETRHMDALVVVAVAPLALDRKSVV